MMSRTLLLSAITTVACASPIGCSEDDSRYVMSEETLVDAAGTHYLGGGCTAIAAGTKVAAGGGVAGGGPGVRFGVAYEGVDDGVKVVLTANADRLERFFDARWLRGEKPSETLELAIDGGRRYSVRLYGGLECVPPKDPDAG